MFEKLLKAISPMFNIMNIIITYLFKHSWILKLPKWFVEWMSVIHDRAMVSLCTHSLATESCETTMLRKVFCCCRYFSEAVGYEVIPHRHKLTSIDIALRCTCNDCIVSTARVARASDMLMEQLLKGGNWLEYLLLSTAEISTKPRSKVFSCWYCQLIQFRKVFWSMGYF